MWKLQENILDIKDKEQLGNYIKSTDRFTQFAEVKRFEESWSKWQDVKYSVFVNSGSSADLIMMDAVKEFYNFPDNSEILVPTVTWTTNITSVIQAGFKPVFVDVNLNDLSFDREMLIKSITDKTKIILITHLIGIPANVKELQKIADEYELIILEDCCESHGAQIDGIKIGNFGVASTFSFYWGHHMTTIEGGMVCTNNEELSDLLYLKRSHGLARELPVEKHEKYKKMYPEIDFNFLFLTYGYNFRNTELHASIGNNQINRLDEYINIRNRNHDYFNSILRNYNDNFFLVDSPGKSSFCLPFFVKDSALKNKIKGELQNKNIEYRPIISGNLLRQPCFSHFYNGKTFPVSEYIHDNGFYIGNNQFVTPEKIDIIHKILTQVIK